MFGRKKAVVALAVAFGLAPAIARAQGVYGAGSAAGAAAGSAYGAGAAAGGAAYGAGAGAARTTGGWGSDTVNRIYDRPASAYAYDAPDVDLYFGAAIPTSHWNDYVNTGGVVGLMAGYRWGLTDNLALGIVANPSFSIGGTDLGGAGGVFLDAGDLAAHPFVEGGAQLPKINQLFHSAHDITPTMTHPAAAKKDAAKWLERLANKVGTDYDWS